MAVTGDAFNLSSTFSNAFKRVFKDDADQDLYNFDSPLLKRVKVTEGFVGSDEERVRATGFMGGYGFGTSLPRNNECNLIRPRLTSKRFYASALVDTESMAAALRSHGAFFELVSRVKLEINRAMNNGLSLALTKANIDNELVLGSLSSSTSNGGGAYSVVVSSMHAQNFHVKQIITVEDGNTDPFEVTDIDAANNKLVIERLSGSQVPASSDELMLQGADGNSFTGLPAACASSGTLYNVAIGAGNNWLAKLDSTGGAITEHRLHNMVLDVANQSGKVPNLIVCGLTQYKKIAEVLANKRVLNDLSDAMGHNELVLAGPEGPIPVIWDRHIENSKVYVLNMDHIELRKRPLSGIVESGGEMLLPMYINGSDQYMVIYRCYGDFYIEPTYQGLISGLDT